MSRFKQQGFRNTFKNARKGLRLALRSEVNIRVHFCVGILVLLAGAYFEFSAEKLCILLLTIGMVITAEMLNSAIEFALDAVFHISAGAVMFITAIAITIGLLLFVPEII